MIVHAVVTELVWWPANIAASRAGDLVLGERAPVGVARLHQGLQEVLALAPGAPALDDDRG